MKKIKPTEIPLPSPVEESIGSGYFIPRSWPNSETSLAFEFWILASRLIVPPSDNFRHCLTQWVETGALKYSFFKSMHIVGEWRVEEIDAAIDTLVRLNYAGVSGSQIVLQRPGLEQVVFMAEAAHAAMLARQLEVFLDAVRKGMSEKEVSENEDPHYVDLFRLRMVMLAEVRRLAPDHPMLGKLDGLTDEYAWLQRNHKKLKGGEKPDTDSGTSFST